MKPSPNVAQALGIPMLDLLPTELLLIIRSYSFDSILWRLCATVNIAQQALNGNGNPQRLKTFRIGEVSAWKRGKEPILTNDSPRDPIIRLTLDAYRIKEVERLPSYSDTLSDQVDSSSTAFAFIDECFIDQRVELNDHLQIFDNTEAARISNAVFHFQFDRARLYFQPPLHGPWVWNTPSPAIRTVSMSSEDRNPTIMVYRTTNLMPLGPPTAHPLLQLFGSSYERVYQIGSTPPCSKGYRLHMFPYAQDRTSWRYYNISLHQTTGLTFLFKSGALYGVHSHTAKMPSAAKLLEWFPYGGGSTLSWVYVPLPPNDDIVAMGLHGRSRKAIMIRKRLSGDILVGYIPSSRPPHFALLNSPPLACVFNQLPSRMVNGFGAVVRDDSSSDNFIQVPTPRPRTSPPFQLGETLPSVASLEGLVRVSVYQAGNRGFCAGLLMEYRNGAQRTLGSCRLGVDPVNTWSEPTHICFLSRTRRDQDISYPIAKVQFNKRSISKDLCVHTTEIASVGRIKYVVSKQAIIEPKPCHS
ncbi:hypothetical protein CEP54_009204 [Fusarium duplospermum]|uniref:Uncharacterized protein n=1 Tax=Fusarium duplospermum TaxID=1325734 RepID=A0A428PS16_9HYPO|nr:hypothetical protein CEP54_009204 [Fusarium duplospermum]